MPEDRRHYLEVPMFRGLVSVSNVGTSGARALLASHSCLPEMEPWGKKAAGDCKAPHSTDCAEYNIAWNVSKI